MGISPRAICKAGSCMPRFDSAVIGKRFPTRQGRVEPEAIARFARALGETNPIYFDSASAIAKGYRAIPAPPTYAICVKMAHQQQNPEQLLWDVLGIDGKGVTLLHAEQSFGYRAPICAGDLLTFEERVADIYEKKNGSLVFVVLETTVGNQLGEAVGVIRHTEVARFET
jgi:acyl dehydratase